MRAWRAVVAGSAIFAAAMIGKAQAQSAEAPAWEGAALRVPSWDRFIDGIRDLPSQMLAKLPPDVRSDPHIQQEIARLALASITNSAIDMIGSDGDHPAFVPQGNFVLNVAEPNPDTIYRAARITPGGTYRLRGRRGSLRMVSLGQAGPLPVEPGFVPGTAPHIFHDVNALKVDAAGNFEVIMSPERPEGHKGDWWKLEPGTSRLVLRMVSSDWGKERDPTFAIERLDAPVRRTQIPAAQVAQKIEMTAGLGSFMALWFVNRVEELRREGYVNRLKFVDISQIGGMAGQSYYEGAYELAEDEALLVEVKAPSKCEYRSLIVTNEVFETLDWLNNQSSLNDSQAKVDPDGMLRIVVSSRDPGVPNWVDTAGHPRGVFQGRWTNCDSQPTPDVRKVRAEEVRSLLPPGTPKVGPQERERIIRERRAAYQQRPLW